MQTLWDLARTQCLHILISDVNNYVFVLKMKLHNTGHLISIVHAGFNFSMTLLGSATLSFVARELIFYRVCIQEYFRLVLCWEVCPLSECPLSEVSLYNNVLNISVVSVSLLVTCTACRSFIILATCNNKKTSIFVSGLHIV